MSATLDRAGFTRAQFWVMMLILAGMFFDTLEQNSVGAMGSNIKASLGIDNAHLTAINTATVIGGLLGRFFGGWLADRWGRRAALGLNLVVYSIGGLISAIAPNYEVLLVSRLIVGIGLGGEFTIGIAMMSEMVATRYRGTLVSVLNIGSGGVGNFVSYGLFFLLLGPLAAGLGGDDLVWRWTFVFLALPALLVVLYRRKLPESPRFLLSQGRVDEANRSLNILISDSLTPPANPTAYLTQARCATHQVKSSPSSRFRTGRATAYPHDRRDLLDGLRRPGHPQLPDADPAGRARLLHQPEPALHHDHERRLAARCLRRRGLGQASWPPGGQTTERESPGGSAPARTLY